MRWMLPLALIALETACAGRPVPPPQTERCLTLADHLRCRGSDGSHFSEPYPGRVMRVCRPVSDDEAVSNWMDAVKR